MASAQACLLRPTRTCCAMRAASPWPTRVQTRGSSKTISDTGTYSTPCATRPPTRHGLNGSGGRPVVAKAGFSWYSERMEQTPFEFTPEQKGILATLSRATGKPIPALLAEALAVLQEREHVSHEAPAPPATSK